RYCPWIFCRAAAGDETAIGLARAGAGRARGSSWQAGGAAAGRRPATGVAGGAIGLTERPILTSSGEPARTFSEGFSFPGSYKGKVILSERRAMARRHLDTVLEHIRKLANLQDARDRSDSQLLHEFSTTQDQAAFATLVQRHGPMVLSVCGHVLRHAQDAEDAFQATFLVLARKAATVRKREALASWLHGVAYRMA